MSLAIERLTWSLAKQGAKALYGAGKFAFQTPKFPADVRPSPRFPGALILQTQQRHFDTSFQTFISGIEASALASLDVLPQDLPALFPLTKLTAFSSVEVFDADGVYIPDPEARLDGRYDVSAILQLTGAWISDTVWSLRFKVCQLKIHGDSPPEPVFPVSLRPTHSYLFVDDPAPKPLFVEDDQVVNTVSEATV